MRSPFGFMLHLTSYWMCVDLWEKSPILLSVCMAGNAIYLLIDALGAVPEPIV